MTKVFRKIAFLTQFGLTMLIPTCLLFFIGYLLDKRFGTSFLSVIGFFIGAVAGGNGVWRLVKKEIGKDSKDVRNRDLAEKQTDIPACSEEKYKKKMSSAVSDEGKTSPDVN